jgi:hypothetical protein
MSVNMRFQRALKRVDCASLMQLQRAIFISAATSGRSEARCRLPYVIGLPDILQATPPLDRGWAATGRQRAITVGTPQAISSARVMRHGTA